jgi:hypothetical protein
MTSKEGHRKRIRTLVRLAVGLGTSILAGHLCGENVGFILRMDAWFLWPMMVVLGGLMAWYIGPPFLSDLLINYNIALMGYRLVTVGAMMGIVEMLHVKLGKRPHIWSYILFLLLLLAAFGWAAGFLFGVNSKWPNINVGIGGI